MKISPGVNLYCDGKLIRRGRPQAPGFEKKQAITLRHNREGAGALPGDWPAILIKCAGRIPKTALAESFWWNAQAGGRSEFPRGTGAWSCRFPPE